MTTKFVALSVVALAITTLQGASALYTWSYVPAQCNKVGTACNTAGSFTVASDANVNVTLPSITDTLNGPVLSLDSTDATCPFRVDATTVVALVAGRPVTCKTVCDGSAAPAVGSYESTLRFADKDGKLTETVVAKSVVGGCASTTGFTWATVPAACDMAASPCVSKGSITLTPQADVELTLTSLVADSAAKATLAIGGTDCPWTAVTGVASLKADTTYTCETTATAISNGAAVGTFGATFTFTDAAGTTLTETAQAVVVATGTCDTAPKFAFVNVPATCSTSESCTAGSFSLTSNVAEAAVTLAQSGTTINIDFAGADCPWTDATAVALEADKTYTCQYSCSGTTAAAQSTDLLFSAAGRAATHKVKGTVTADFCPYAAAIYSWGSSPAQCDTSGHSCSAGNFTISANMAVNVTLAKLTKSATGPELKIDVTDTACPFNTAAPSAVTLVAGTPITCATVCDGAEKTSALFETTLQFSDALTAETFTQTAKSAVAENCPATSGASTAAAVTIPAIFVVSLATFLF